MSQYLIGITGGQGVGKSTFCAKLSDYLNETLSISTCIIGGLGEKLKSRGIPYGSAATPDGIAAAYSAHIHREFFAPSGIVLLDRCLVDALAYVRGLKINSSIEQELYQNISLYQSRNLSLVIHLEMTGMFLKTIATHETPTLRTKVAQEIYEVIKMLNVKSIALNAAVDDAIQHAAEAIISIARP